MIIFNLLSLYDTQSYLEPSLLQYQDRSILKVKLICLIYNCLPNCNVLHVDCRFLTLQFYQQIKNKINQKACHFHTFLTSAALTTNKFTE